MGGCAEKWLGVCHGSDIIYLFGLDHTRKYEEDYKLSREMMHAWTSFAKTGHPGLVGSVEWTEAFDPKDPFTEHINLNGDKVAMVKDYFKETCNALWKPKIFTI